MTDIDPTVVAVWRAIKTFNWGNYGLDDMPTGEPDWVEALADRVLKAAEVEELRWMVGDQEARLIAQAKRIAELEAELGSTRQAMELLCRRRDDLTVEVADAKARIEEASLVRRWVNEDGKGFVFADDLLAALHPELAKPESGATSWASSAPSGRPSAKAQPPTSGSWTTDRTGLSCHPPTGPGRCS